MTCYMCDNKEAETGERAPRHSAFELQPLRCEHILCKDHFREHVEPSDRLYYNFNCSNCVVV